MKKIIAKQKNPQLGLIKVNIIIDGKFIYLKCNNLQYGNQVMNQLRNGGAEITLGENRRWIKIDLFKDKEIAKLGEKEFNPNEDLNKTEEILTKFYKGAYTKANFIVEEIK